MSEKVFLTGATGLAGSHIAEYFVSKGIDVRCLVRESSNRSFLESLGVEIVIGDIRDEINLSDSVGDSDFVIHTAALASDWGKPSDFDETNVKGAINVLKACSESGIGNAIFTGSVSSYGEEDFSGVKDEDYPYNSHYQYFLDSVFPCGMNLYRDSKAMMTQKTTAFAKENGVNLTILEPVFIYGEREFNSGFYEYVKSVKDGSFIMPGSKRNKLHTIYAGELAIAYYLAYERRLEGVHRIILGNEKAELMDRIFNLFCREADLSPPKKIPKWLFYPVGLVLESVYSLMNTKKPPLLTRGRVNMFYDNNEFSTRKAKEILGFRTQMSIEDSIAKTVRWYKDNHLF